MKRNIKIAQMTKELMKDKDIADVAELQSMLKEMPKNVVESLLEAELDDELSFERYDNSTPKSNYRIGTSKKTVRTDLCEVELNIPRDREGEFEPQIIPKNSRDLSAIEDKVISMYAKA